MRNSMSLDYLQRVFESKSVALENMICVRLARASFGGKLHLMGHARSKYLQREGFRFCPPWARVCSMNSSRGCCYRLRGF